MVLRDHVGRRAQGERELSSALGVEIECDAAPAAAFVVEGEVLVHELDPAAAHAQHVEVCHRLDLDHVGAQFRQHATHLGDDRGHPELDDSNAIQQQLVT